MYSYKAVPCDFCGKSHGNNIECCEMKLNGVEGNSEEGSKFTIKQIIEAIHTKRPLIFVVMFKAGSGASCKDLEPEYDTVHMTKDKDAKKDKVMLDTCF